MKKLTLLNTFFSKILLLVFNFGLVIYSTQVWGSNGKGIISIVIANLALISFVSQIFVGSSITYFASKSRKEVTLLYAYIWSFLIGGTLPFVFSLFIKDAFIYHLLLLSIFFSLYTANLNFFVGQKKMNAFNLYTLLQQLLHVLFIFFMVSFFNQKQVEVYFNALIACYGLLFFISFFQIFNSGKWSGFQFSFRLLSQLFHYGWKTQLSAFFQFLNYRLSYYFLGFYHGLSSVGIFSIGVAFSEAIWTVSRSLSLVLYSELVNSKQKNANFMRTKISLKISFWLSLLFLFIMLLIPSEVYTLVFGKDFHQTKQIILFLSPGILAIAVSNIIGYYFAGINELNILNTKSIIGLLFTVLLSFFLIPKFGIKGASLVMSISYCLSSLVLFWKFHKLTDWSAQDLLFSRKELSFFVPKRRKN